MISIRNKQKFIEQDNLIKARLNSKNIELNEQKLTLELELLVNRKLFITISKIIVDSNIFGRYTQEFLDEFADELAKDAKKAALNLARNFKKSSSYECYVPKSTVPQQVFHREAREDMHWYRDDEMEALLQHFFAQDQNVHVFTAIDAHQLDGNTLTEQLQQAKLYTDR